MKQTIYWPGMSKDVQQYVQQCHECKVSKPQRQYGTIPEQTITTRPWNELYMDLIGPFNQQYALVILDVATKWIEMIPLENKRPATVARAFDQQWLCRYPRPTRLIHDQGPEFIYEEFQELLHRYGITDVPTTVANATANAENERTHRTIEEIIRTQHGHYMN